MKNYNSISCPYVFIAAILRVRIYHQGQGPGLERSTRPLLHRQNSAVYLKHKALALDDGVEVTFGPDTFNSPVFITHGAVDFVNLEDSGGEKAGLCVRFTDVLLLEHFAVNHILDAVVLS